MGRQFIVILFVLCAWRAEAATWYVNASGTVNDPKLHQAIAALSETLNATQTLMANLNRSAALCYSACHASPWIWRGR